MLSGGQVYGRHFSLALCMMRSKEENQKYEEWKNGGEKEAVERTRKQRNSKGGEKALQQYEAEEENCFENSKWKRTMDRDREKHYNIKPKKRRKQ